MLCSDSRWQRMIPQEEPRVFCASHASTASAPFEGPRLQW